MPRVLSPVQTAQPENILEERRPITLPCEAAFGGAFKGLQLPPQRHTETNQDLQVMENHLALSGQ